MDLRDRLTELARSSTSRGPSGPPGAPAQDCGALAGGGGPDCRLSGNPIMPVELSHAMSDRVLAVGRRVEVIDRHARLAELGGVAAMLRYPCELAAPREDSRANDLPNAQSFCLALGM